MTMVKMIGHRRGYTLVELVITIMISGILFFAVGTIIFQSESWWMKQSRTAATFDDQMYARRFIEWQIKSSTGPYTVTRRENEPQSIQYHGFLNPGVTTHRTIELVGNELIYTEINQEDQEIAREVIISSVTQDSGFVIVPRPNGPMGPDQVMMLPTSDEYDELQSTATLYGFFIEQYKNVYVGDTGTPQRRTSSFSFTVNSRNQAQGLTVEE